jgi:recombinational DNA repair protein (RecF pathway)
MHHIYTTQGFIVHSSPQGESGKFLLIFTKDFGMIGATAQGIRLDQSKLRYHIQDFDLANISIVRGKEVWRITGASEMDHENITKVHIQILKLLKRLLQGEDKNEKLFEIIEELYKTKIENNDFEYIEIITVLRILESLGYIKENKKFIEILQSNKINSQTIDFAKTNKSLIVQEINTALKASHL